MQVVYPAAFAAMIAEGFVAVRAGPGRGARGRGGVRFWQGAEMVGDGRARPSPGRFASSSFRAPPLVGAGPYRFLRHPNYIGVVGELVGAALVAGAVVAGPSRSRGLACCS